VRRPVCRDHSADFNTVFASKQAQPTSDEGLALDGLYAGNDDKAKGAVAEWLSATGYRPIDADEPRNDATLSWLLTD
jgi:predicted dinucleotide-binding enzyme